MRSPWGQHDRRYVYVTHEEYVRQLEEVRVQIEQSQALIRPVLWSNRHRSFNSARGNKAFWPNGRDRRKFGGGRARAVFSPLYLTRGGCVAWIVRLVKIGADGEEPLADV